MGFWGLILESHTQYSQKITQPFRLTMASLDIGSSKDEIIQVILLHKNKRFLLCNLEKSSVWQVPLDLTFYKGMTVGFTISGNARVHLTGYMLSNTEVPATEMKNFKEAIVDLQMQVSKRKASDSPKEKIAKRLNTLNLMYGQNEESEESEDENETQQEDNTEVLHDELDIEDEEEEEEDSEDAFEDEEEEDDDEVMEEEEEEEEEQEKQSSPQEKKAKHTQEQQLQSQEKKKHDKQKLQNGREAKQEQSKQQKNKPEQQQQQKSSSQQGAQKKQLIKYKVEGGVEVQELKIGEGAQAKAGKFISVYYTGRFTNGKKFDSTMVGDGFKFRLGKAEVIKGWDYGIVGMKVGGKRRITVPPALAYGSKGCPPTIPPSSTLIFDVELKQVY